MAKTIDDAVRDFLAIRDEREKLKREYEEKDKRLTDIAAKIEAFILRKSHEAGVTSFKTPAGTAGIRQPFEVAEAVGQRVPVGAESFRKRERPGDALQKIVLVAAAGEADATDQMAFVVRGDVERVQVGFTDEIRAVLLRIREIDGACHRGTLNSRKLR